MSEKSEKSKKKTRTAEEKAARKKLVREINLEGAVVWTTDRIGDVIADRLREHAKDPVMTYGKICRLGDAYMDAFDTAMDEVDENHVHEVYASSGGEGEVSGNEDK